MRPRGTHERASAWCLRGVGLGSWRLDGDARSASKGGGSRGAARKLVVDSWPRHCGERSSDVLRHVTVAQRRAATRRDG
jgi:hypothetical protein